MKTLELKSLRVFCFNIVSSFNWIGYTVTTREIRVRISTRLQIGRVIKLALDLVLKTSGTFGYGDRYLTLPQPEGVRMDEDTALKAAGPKGFGGSIPSSSATGE